MFPGECLHHFSIQAVKFCTRLLRGVAKAPPALFIYLFI